MFDRSSTGFITQREFKEAVRQLGLPLTFTQVHALMERFVHFSDSNKVSFREFLDSVATRQRLASSRQATRLLMNTTKPLSVNGSGYDGLSMNGDASLQIVPGRVDDRGFGANETGAGASNYSRFDSKRLGPPPRTIEKWLNESASRAEREKFADVYDSISQYDRDEKQRQAPWYDGDEKEGQGGGSALVDHRNNQIVRVVSHVPYDIANSGMWNDRARSRQRRSTVRWDDEEYDGRDRRQDRQGWGDDRDTDRDWGRSRDRDRDRNKDSRDRFDRGEGDRFDRDSRDRFDRDTRSKDRFDRNDRDNRDSRDRFDRFDRDDRGDRGTIGRDRDSRDRDRDSRDRNRDSRDRNRDSRDRDRGSLARSDDRDDRDRDRKDRYDRDNRERSDRDRSRDRRRSDRDSQW